MTFAPLKADRCLLWISLREDTTVSERYAALRAALKPCRLHPLDTTAGAELVIVEEAAFDAQADAIRAALGPGDMLHKIAGAGGRLVVTVIALPDVLADRLPTRPPERRPAWLRE
jgi:hypothetical protein